MGILITESRYKCPDCGKRHSGHKADKRVRVRGTSRKKLKCRDCRSSSSSSSSSSDVGGLGVFGGRSSSSSSSADSGRPTVNAGDVGE